jgi:hypothetical protein
VKEGNTLETDEENLTELVQQTERFEKKQVPVLRTGGFWGLALLDAGIGPLEIKNTTGTVSGVKGFRDRERFSILHAAVCFWSSIKRSKRRFRCLVKDLKQRPRSPGRASFSLFPVADGVNRNTDAQGKFRLGQTQAFSYTSSISCCILHGFFFTSRFLPCYFFFSDCIHMVV